MSSLVSVSNFAQEGPAELTLHDKETAIAGLVLHKHRPLQGSLRGSSGKVLAHLTDVQEMLAKDATCEFIVCMPIEPTPETATASTQRGALLFGFSGPPDLGRRRLSALSLLCNLLASALPRVVEDVLALVAHICGTPALCTCCIDDSEDEDDEHSHSRGSPCKEDEEFDRDGTVPGLPLPISEGNFDGRRGSVESSDTMAPLSPLPSHITGAGNNADARKSWQQDAEPGFRPSCDSVIAGSARYSTDSAYSTLYHDATMKNGNNNNNNHTSAANRLDTTVEVEEPPARPGRRVSFDNRVSFDARAGTSRRSFDYRAQRRSVDGFNTGSQKSDVSNTIDNSSNNNVASDCAPDVSHTSTVYDYDDAWSVGTGSWGKNSATAGIAPTTSFSKAVLTDLQIEDVEQRNSFSLSFNRPAVEDEFTKWYGRRQHAADVMFSLLLVLTMVLLACQQPFSFGLHMGVVTKDSLFASMMALPLLLILFSRNMYMKHRDIVIVAMRLYMVAYIHFISMPVFQSYLPHDPWWRCLCFWLLSGGESLSSAALGMQVRMALHIPLQFAMLAVSAWHVPAACSTCYPSVDGGVCFAQGLGVMAGIGCVLPTAVLWMAEKRARDVFSYHMVNAAGLRPDHHAIDASS